MHRIYCTIVLYIFCVTDINAQNPYDPDFYSLPPGAYQNTGLFKDGFLSVEVFGAIPDDNDDDTQAIQEAINTARDNKMVCYFPKGPGPGIYHISGPLNCMMDLYINDAYIRGEFVPDAYVRDRKEPVVLVGEPHFRPTLNVASGTFTDVANPEPVIRFWAAPASNCPCPAPGYPAQVANCTNYCYPGSEDPDDFESGINFNQSIRGFNIEIEANNPGAIAIQHGGDQGASVEDITINSVDAFAGIKGHGGGAAGGMFNVEIIGGKYAMIFENYLSNYPLIVGCKFIDQDEEVFRSNTGNIWHPIQVTGFYIKRKNNYQLNNFIPLFGGLSLVDGSIEVSNNTTNNLFTSSNNAGNPLHLDNVFIKNTNYISSHDFNIADSSFQLLNPTTWNQIKEYIHTGTGNNVNIVSCGQAGDSFLKQTASTSNHNPQILLDKHLWDEPNYPAITRQGVNYVNVKRDYNKMNQSPAFGDGSTDDTDAIQYAIDNFQTVFLPKGNYQITRPLQLKADTWLFGIGKVFSQIRTDSSWVAAYDGEPIIATANDSTGMGSLSFLGIMQTPSSGGVSNKTSISWQLGANSMVRDINLGPYNPLDTGQYTQFYNLPNDDANFNMVELSGFGGGRWYVVATEFTAYAPATSSNSKAFFVDGTNQETHFYGMNVERVAGEPQAAFRNASNIYVHYFKAESRAPGHPNSLNPLSLTNVAATRIFTASGNVDLPSGDAFIEIGSLSQNVIITNVRSLKTTAGSSVLKEVCEDGTTNNQPINQTIAYYKRPSKNACTHEYLTINDMPIQDSLLVKVKYDINSSGTILGNDDVMFKAGNSIKLDNGFCVGQGAKFSIEIKDCILD